MSRPPLHILVALAVVVATASGCALHRGKMSAGDVAKFMERTAPTMLNVNCSNVDTNGWDYSCAYTDRSTGKQMKMGVRAFAKTFTGAGSVPADQPLPPPPA